MLPFVIPVLFTVGIFGRISEANEGSKSQNDIFNLISSLESQIESLNKTILNEVKHQNENLTKVLEIMENNIENLDNTIESQYKGLNETILNEVKHQNENLTKALETMENNIENLDNTIESQYKGLNETMEILLDQGQRQELLNDPCLTSQYLNESWRHIDYIGRHRQEIFCDKVGISIYSNGYTQLAGGWFRFGSAAGSRLPTFRAPGEEPGVKQVCGTKNVAYIIHGGHPTRQEGIVTREVCFEGLGGHCHRSTSERIIGEKVEKKKSKYRKTIRVAACSDEDGEYYVYDLKPVEICSLAYCAIDEKTRFCPSHTPFHCHSGECIQEGFQCDGKQECRDGTDEKNCQSFVCPSERPFKCKSGECIKSEFRCDGRKHRDGDCPDGSDEDDCHDYVCPEDQPFHCGSGECIREEFVCDGTTIGTYSDKGCKDKSDEQNCQDYVCPLDRPFHCTSSECIGLEGRCDGETGRPKDCKDGSEERNCTGHVCPADKYQCKSGHCETEYAGCNGRYQCADKSDEDNCQDNVCEYPDFQWQCKYGACIDNYRRCDGEDNCVDKSDEQDCQDHVCLNSQGQFQCKTGHCIFSYQKCDGRVQCPDGSDEENC